MRELYEFTADERARIDEIGADYNGLDADDIALLIEWNSRVSADKAANEALNSEIGATVRSIAERERAKVGKHE